MKKIIFYLIIAFLLFFFILIVVKNLKNHSNSYVNPIVTPTTFISLSPVKDQGVIFKGIMTYGKGTQRNCTQLQDQLKVECEKNNMVNSPNPIGTQPTIATLTIKNSSNSFVTSLTTDGSKDYKIPLNAGIYTICAKNITGQPCGQVVVTVGKYVDFAIPIPAQ